MGPDGAFPENACRLCDTNGAPMHSVFERVEEGPQLLQLVKDTLRILIYRTDPLSKQVCDGCYTNLVTFSRFQRVALETLDQQKHRLERRSKSSVSVELFLNALEQENDVSHLNNTEANERSESEMCIQLRKDIQESLRISQLEEQQLANGTENGLESYDCESQRADSPSQSDMELCDSDMECSPTIITTSIRGKRLYGNENGPPAKRKRFVGPKSRITERKERYLKILEEQEGRSLRNVKYNPLSLLNCVLNHINKQNVPEYESKSYEEVETLALGDDNVCSYCDGVFLNSTLLASHECSHMYVVLGEKVDIPKPWRESNEDSAARNKWLNSINSPKPVEATPFTPSTLLCVRKEMVVENFDDSTGRVDVIDPENVQDLEESTENEHVPPVETKGEVVLIDTQATVNGIPLIEMVKDERRTLYRTVMVNGIKRKFCPLCRYTFKDNWAIESHYFSTACHYTCRFCGVRFNKQRSEFDNHIKQHILAGDLHTTKIFASRKYYSVPRVISEKKMTTKVAPPQRPPPKVRKIIKRMSPPPIEAKRRKTSSPMAPPVEVKQERLSPVPGQEGIRTDGKQNQAYFCRKCYQVFFKLNEFNVHVISCKGTSFINNRFVANSQPKPQLQAPPQRLKTPQEPEKFSPTGRPIRNCVKEVGTYADTDDLPEDVEVQTQAKKPPVVKSARGFECGMCSSCFPTVHSRNSHMRIHKSAMQQTPSPNRNTRQEARRIEKSSIPTFNKYVNDVKIKQEPTEPLVEIEEPGNNVKIHTSTPSSKNFPSSIGSVSITPIPNSSQKTTLDPNIMKLVQNNPNLTIKALSEQQKLFVQSRSTLGPGDGDVKCYRCLSCSKPFANKSNLYFHKKNQCSGSKYPCPFCKKRFGTEAAYSSHIFYNHPE